MRVLILVDLQNDFCPGGSLAVPDGNEVIPVANQLQPHFELVFATQDWHPADHSSFAANHPGRSVGERIEIEGEPQVLWPVHCVQGTHGAEFVEALDRRRIDRVFRKGVDPAIDSYSGFYDNARRRSTGLGEHLQELGARSCTVLGLATDYCVLATVLDARALGFEVVVVEDGCRGVELHSGDVVAAWAAMSDAGARRTSSRELAR